jgi:DHA2 family multidrug resistance protein-like MFS transporter
VPADAAEAARSTLGGARGISDQLPAGFLETAGGAFTDGMRLAAVVAAALLIGTAVVAGVVLRNAEVSPQEP